MTYTLYYYDEFLYNIGQGTLENDTNEELDEETIADILEELSDNEDLSGIDIDVLLDGYICVTGDSLDHPILVG